MRPYHAGVHIAVQYLTRQVEDSAEMSARLACSPSRAFADEVEAHDDVLLDDGGSAEGGSGELGGASEFLPSPETLTEEHLEQGKLESEREKLEKEEHELRSQWSAAEAQAMDFEQQQHRCRSDLASSSHALRTDMMCR